jgi:hypothetical protein
MTASGISSRFQLLSQSSGQVSHVFLTRSPLGLPLYCYKMDPVRLACVKHAASVRPEPGSNSPSRTSHRSEDRSGKSAGVQGEYSLCMTPTTDLIVFDCFQSGFLIVSNRLLSGQMGIWP